jgi:hypothetical protein
MGRKEASRTILCIMYSNAAKCTVFKEGVNHSSELFWAAIGTELAARTPSERFPSASIEPLNTSSLLPSPTSLHPLVNACESSHWTAGSISSCEM